MPFDKWTIVDIISACFNIVCFNVIGSLTPEQVLNPAKKETIDYYVIAVLIASWLRFFMYFLVISHISKLLNTLVRMLYTTLSFIFIVACYMAMVSTMFTMLFNSVNKDKYQFLTLSLRSLFDAMLTNNYAYETNPDYQLSFSILLMIHIFIANIFLLNYLIAILATVYEIMQEHGQFSYKQNKYEFIEKYSIAMSNDFGYQELVIHPPPLNFFGFFILPCAVKKECMKSAGHVYATIIFWFENGFYFLFLFFYELVLLPFIYLRVIYNVIRMASACMLIPYVLLWFFVGPFYLLVRLFIDLFYLGRIFCDTQHEEDAQKQKEEEDYKYDKIMIYNEVITVMNSIKTIKEKTKQDLKKKRLLLKGGATRDLIM